MTVPYKIFNRHNRYNMPVGLNFKAGKHSKAQFDNIKIYTVKSPMNKYLRFLYQVMRLSLLSKSSHSNILKLCIKA